MLSNLDNEVIFKKAFTDKIVLKAFVHDVLGLDVEVEKIETEKKFDPKIGFIDFELDIFAETSDKRFVIEIQRVEYDHHFDRFLHYFLMMIAEQQKRAAEYRIDQTVYLIMVLTAPYTIKEKSGYPIKDEVLAFKINPKTLSGIERDLYGHQFVCLNPNHSDATTPQAIRDWMDLIYQSIHNRERPVLNIQNEGIRRAVELISFENMTPEERTAAKNKEASRVTRAIYEDLFRTEEKREIAKKLKMEGIPNGTISKVTGLDLAEVEAL